MTLDERRIKAARQCMTALGTRWRGDWSDFDGRVLRAQLEDVDRVLVSENPEPLADEFVREQELASEF